MMGPAVVMRKPLLYSLIGAAALVFLGGLWSWYEGPHGAAAARLACAANPQQRLHAIDELEQLHSGLARRTLLGLVSDPEPEVAAAALRAVAIQGDPSSRQAVLKLTQTAPTPALRAEAAAALGRFKTGDGAKELEVLTTLMREAEEPEVRAGAAQGLVRLSDPRSLPAALEALVDDDPRVRAWALEVVHAGVTTRFAFDPLKPPAKQKDQRAAIEAYLRERNLLP